MRTYFRSPAAIIESFGTREVARTVAGLEPEYHAIRTGVGVSDVSDMTKLALRGAGAVSLLAQLVAGDIDRMVENSVRWTIILDKTGKVVADVQVYKDFSDYFLTCDHDARETVIRLVRELAGPEVQIDDLSDTLAAISVEGPDALNLPAALLGPEAGGLSFLRFVRGTFSETNILLARIGFTAEFGYIIFVPVEAAGAVLARIIAAEPSAVPCGRAVQSVLRLEVRAFNRSLDLLHDETALEAGLHWMIDFRKPAFLGREAVLTEKRSGLRQRLVGFLVDGVADIKRGAPVRLSDRAIGYVANSGYSYRLRRTVGLCYVLDRYAWVGVPLRIDDAIGGVDACVASAPFLVTESTDRARG